MSDELNSTTMDTPVGVLTLVASAQGLRLVLWEGEDADRVAGDTTTDADPEAKEVLERAVEQLDEYFAGERTEFDLPLDPKGTDFQLQVWQVLRTIPPGRSLSYSEVAERIGSPKAVRAVAQACGANRLAVAIPCHRVIRRDGDMAGYRWGVERKALLRQREAQG